MLLDVELLIFLLFPVTFTMIDVLEPEGGKVMKITLKTALKRSILSQTWVLPESIKLLSKHKVCFVKWCLNTL